MKQQRILTARRPASWLCTSEGQKLNQGLPEISQCGIFQLGLVAWICQQWGAVSIQLLDTNSASSCFSGSHFPLCDLVVK